MGSGTHVVKFRYRRVDNPEVTRHRPKTDERGATLVGYAIATAAVLSGIVASLGALESGMGTYLGAQGVEVNQPLPDVNATPDSLPFHDDADDWTGITTPDDDDEGTSGSVSGTVNGGSDDTTTTSTTAAPTTTTTAAPAADLEKVYEGTVGIEHSGKCLRVKNNGQLTQHRCNDNDDRTITFLRDDDGSLVLKAPDGRCLGPANSSNAQGAQIWAQECDSEDLSQKWRQDGDRLINEANGKCLDVYGASGSNNAALIQWSCHGGGNQNFPLLDGDVAGDEATLAVAAADATLAGDMARSTVDGRTAIGTPNRGRANYQNARSTDSKATFTFTVTEAGRYNLVGDVIAPDGVSDSFWIQMNGSPNNGTAWHTGQSQSWTTRTGPEGYLLEAGEHTVTLSWREDGTWIDGLELVKQ